MADCLLLGAKLSLESTRLEEAIDKCQKSLYVGGRNRNKFQLCDTYFTKGKCYLQLKKRDKAFEAFKSARQTLEYLKSQPRDYIEFKNKIDEAFLNFPNRNN
jgi:tetratricopeptide (TPR) repeat protein